MVRCPNHIYLAFVIGVVVFLCIYLLDPTERTLFFLRIKQLSIAVEYRVKVWDWKDTAEERFCRSAHQLSPPQEPISNVVNFILLGKDGAPVDLIYAQFLALKAAILRMNASEIRLHTNGFNTRNVWWQEIRDHIALVTVDTTELHAPDGTSFTSLQVPHQADLLRLYILARDGGIYLDTDVYALKPFTPLLSNPRDVVMGHEGGNRYGLCNAVIVARAESEFISLWQETYASFNPRIWNEHSVRKPKQLQVQYPDLICPLSPSVFFWPTWAWTDVQYMHNEILSAEETALLQSDMESFGGTMYENQLAFHAWGAHHVLEKLTPEMVETINTRFHVLLRDIAKAPL